MDVMLIEIVAAALMIAAACRYLGPIMDWFERERGTGPGNITGKIKRRIE